MFDTTSLFLLYKWIYLLQGILFPLLIRIKKTKLVGTELVLFSIASIIIRTIYPYNLFFSFTIFLRSSFTENIISFCYARQYVHILHILNLVVIQMIQI